MSLSFFLFQIIAFALIVEVVTTALRLVYHLKARHIQRDKLHMPRIHHSYVGLLMVSGSYYLEAYRDWLIVIGWVLILSDLFHHLITIPLLKRFNWDIGMNHHRFMHRLMRGVLGPVFILAGLLALFTPFTPGSWLVLPGLIFVLGEKRGKAFIRACMPGCTYENWGMEKLLSKFH